MNISSAEFVKGIRGSDGILSENIPAVAFIGRSNVGKSSILNALAGKAGMARVGDKPGKTTEINFFLINRTHYFVDLPGYGYSTGERGQREKLRKLIIWYFTAGEAHPQKVVLILESKAGLTKFDEEMIQVLKERGHPYVVVVNKTDKLSQKELQLQIAKIQEKSGGEVIQTSVPTGKGIDELRDILLATK